MRCHTFCCSLQSCRQICCNPASGLAPTMLPASRLLPQLSALQPACSAAPSAGEAAMQATQQLNAAWLSRLLSSSTASCSQRTPSSSPLGHGRRKRADAAEGDDKATSTSTPVYLLRSQYAYDDEGQAQNKLKFVSRERRLVPRPPFYRPPIYFPDIRLQMLKLTDEQRQQIKETGWTREVAFKTTPNMTKLEIKGVLESMYGMQVERVHTINYLGRKYVTFKSNGNRPPHRQEWRADDWKKAYVIFRPPPGVQLTTRSELEQGQPKLSMIDQLLIAKGLKKAPTAAAPAGEAEEGSEAVVEGATAVEQPALAAAAPAAAQAAAPPAQALAQAGRQAEGQAVGQAQVGQGQQGGADQGAPR